MFWGGVGSSQPTFGRKLLCVSELRIELCSRICREVEKGTWDAIPKQRFALRWEFLGSRGHSETWKLRSRDRFPLQ